MRIIVTGAAGFVGSHLVDRLLTDGHDVVGIDAFIPYYPRADKEQNLSDALQHPRFRLAELDLRHDPLEDLLNRADAIVHEAAMPGLPLSWSQFDLYMTCNIQATQRLLAAARAQRVPRLVYASTSSVYGVQAIGDEDALPRPVSPYGVTKLAAEQLCLAYHMSHRLDVVVCRYFSIFGPRQRPDMAYRIFIRALLAGQPLVVFGDGRQRRGNTYVGDCVDATVRALHNGAAGQVYNVGGGTEVELIEAIHVLERLTGRTAIIRHEPARPGDQRRTLANCARIRAELGWEPRTSLEEGLAHEVAWLIARHQTESPIAP